ncbi:MAG: BlaI/MecI/CopY family transcriptional regulator [Acidobacteriota bacterium]
MVKEVKSRAARSEPTEAELEILEVLWDRGPSTVAETAAKLPHRPGYTTVLKLLQIMLGKGWVERDESSRRHVYAARVTRSEARSRLVGNLLRRAFGGSPSGLVLHALESQPVSEEELEKIEAALAEARRRRDEETS